MGLITDFRQAIVDRLATIDGLNASRSPIGVPTTPFAFVTREHTAYDETAQRGTDLYQFRVSLIVANASDRGAQDALDQYVDPTGDRSIKATLEATRDDDLTDMAGDLLRVTEVGADESYERTVGTKTARYLGVDFLVEVYLSGA